ncbi:2-C-methyl-D-erythritol 4-phosphate cytidylyltransferase [Macrococcus carouselicus]|uniref:2-C-methyl-D-erythritol 4-phosphate cytidylyltransferase n=2 Tax=Macrococcus carouselicus TaxID=69969 RepID=A0A9Q8CF45_9STAP|nr:2-C-methyl-D-erythritol 4-phosphate cytidylyltransferase [Macrococcus carouselicus]TDM00897.1 2-C-methyl-D-erythritol 4-phosphate cytidylyltransferase [Macrococcus carouselicus]
MMYTVIIPAAGQGKRMGSDRNKVFLELDGRPVIYHTVSKFDEDASCQAIYLSARQDEVALLTELLKGFHKVKGLVIGGSERQYSIYNALKVIPPCEVVMVHDAARPFVSQETLTELYDAACAKNAVIAAVPVKDTIKVINNGVIDHTPDRNVLWQVQTPQAFKYELLLEAYQQAAESRFLGTDDASLVERLGVPVSVVVSDYDNIKLTTPEDLYFAEAIMKKRGI